jgi:hypothetical protein
VSWYALNVGVAYSRGEGYGWGMRRIISVAGLALTAMLMLSGCSSTENWIADAMRALGTTPGTVYNYGPDGQLVYSAHCRSLAFRPDHTFDVYNDEGKKTGDSSVIEISCGDNIIRTVGFTTVYISDKAQGALFANSQQFANLRIHNNDRSIPLVNFAWRSVKSNFAGTAGVAQVCDQWNNPILAFAGTINGFSADVVKSTMFQVKYNDQTGYVWVSRGSYTVTDAALLG